VATRLIAGTGRVIHNFADAATAIPLGVAFGLARRGATPRFTHRLGRIEGGERHLRIGAHAHDGVPMQTPD